MKKIRSILMSLITLGLLSGAGIAEDANADVYVDATLHTPNVRVRIGNSPYSNYRSVTTTRRTVVVHPHYNVTRNDWKVAGRLAWYTGVPARRMIRLKSAGYRWGQIGRRLHMPRPVVRAALHRGTWKHFLRDERRLARCDDGARTWQVTYSGDGHHHQ